MKFLILNAFLCMVLCILLQNVESREIQNRIISGTAAAPGQFPWQVILKKEEIDDLLCGGSIISPNWVLTAGHCTYGLTSIYLIFGTVDIDNEAINMTSTQLIEHPQYNNQNLNNDVALIGLPTPLTYTTYIQPISLVPSAQISNSFLGTVATVAGFGLTDDEYLDFSTVLLYAQVQIIDNSQCVQVYGSAVVISSTLCAKGNGGTNQSICSGDSGGPLITQDANGKFIQIGINSFVAQDMCTNGYPSGYVRLTSFLDFITQTTGLSD